MFFKKYSCIYCWPTFGTGLYVCVCIHIYGIGFLCIWKDKESWKFQVVLMAPSEPWIQSEIPEEKLLHQVFHATPAGLRQVHNKYRVSKLSRRKTSHFFSHLMAPRQVDFVGLQLDSSCLQISEPQWQRKELTLCIWPRVYRSLSCEHVFNLDGTVAQSSW